MVVLNPDCVRDVLMAVEGCDYGERLTVKRLSEKLPDYSEEELCYTCIKLEEGGYLKLMLIHMTGTQMPGIKQIGDLTYEGHEFLSNIRKDDIWSGVKTVASKVGSTSLSALGQIAANVVTELIKAQFGITALRGV